MKDATIVMEDKTFYQNCGVDWNAISAALRADIRSGAFRYEGSTITQQLARNLFLTPYKTISRKQQELCIALLMNRMLPKNRILELYLNTVDYGMGYHRSGPSGMGLFSHNYQPAYAPRECPSCGHSAPSSKTQQVVSS